MEMEVLVTTNKQVMLTRRGGGRGSGEGEMEEEEEEEEEEGGWRCFLKLECPFHVRRAPMRVNAERRVGSWRKMQKRRRLCWKRRERVRRPGA